MTTSTDNAGVIARPPLLYLAALIACFLLRWQLPAAHRRADGGDDASSALRWAPCRSASVCGAGRRCLPAGTNLDPMATTTAIVDRRYRIASRAIRSTSRWPDSSLDFTLGFNDWWGVVVLLPLLAVMHGGVVLREEHYLERKFGDEYRQYQSRVARYLG